MGTLGGHVLPGTFFIIFGIWWSIITSMRLIYTSMRTQSRKKETPEYRATVTMPCICLPCTGLRRAPIESWFKFIFGTIGLLGEVITGLHYEYSPAVSHKSPTNGSQMHMDMNMDHHHHHKRAAVNNNLVRHLKMVTVNTQHIVMYTGFIFGALIEILAYHKFTLPKRLPHTMGILAFIIEAFLFANHLHSRHMLDIHVHTLLVYAIYGCVFFSFLETVKPDQIIFTYGRTAFTIFQGTWFWEVGFVLYPPFDDPWFIWEKDNHSHIMLITGSYCWHLIFIIAGMLLQIGVMKSLYRTSAKFRSYFDRLIEVDAYFILDDERDYMTRSFKADEENKYFTLVSDDDEDVQFDSTKLLMKSREHNNDIKLEKYKDNEPSESSSTSGNHSSNLI